MKFSQTRRHSMVINEPKVIDRETDKSYPLFIHNLLLRAKTFKGPTIVIEAKINDNKNV